MTAGLITRLPPLPRSTQAVVRQHPRLQALRHVMEMEVPGALSFSPSTYAAFNQASTTGNMVAIQTPNATADAKKTIFMVTRH